MITATGVALASGLAAGLISTPHCAAMCGPLCTYACKRGRAASALLSYQAGRTLSYAAVGALAGALGGGLVSAMSGNWGSIVLAWLLALTLLLAGIAMWRKPRSAEELEVAPAPSVRRQRRSMAARIMALLPRNPLLLGLVTALLPCGALYAAIALAAATGSALAGSALMTGFALTSAVLLLGAGALASRLRGVRRGLGTRIIAVALILGGLLLAYRPIRMLTRQSSDAAEPPPCPLHHSALETQEPGAHHEDEVGWPS